MEQLFLHSGRDDHYLPLFPPPRADQFPDADLTREAVLLPLFVALQQFVNGADAGGIGRMRLVELQQHRQVVPGIKGKGRYPLRPGLRRQVVRPPAAQLGQNFFLLQRRKPLLFQGEIESVIGRIGHIGPMIRIASSLLSLASSLLFYTSSSWVQKYSIVFCAQVWQYLSLLSMVSIMRS